MRRYQIIDKYKTLTSEEIFDLIKQKKDHIDFSDKIIPYNNDTQWMDDLKNCWWSVQHEERELPFDKNIDKLFVLRDKLLSIGGCDVCLPVAEEDIDDILRYGQLWDNTVIQPIKGDTSRCHSNSANLWYNNRNSCEEHDFAVIICTGYALSEDGIWRQHTWLVMAAPRSNNIIETTEKRIAYFGFGMTYNQAEEFEYNNS